MVDYSNASLQAVTVHIVGNKAIGDELQLSGAPIDTSDIRLYDLLHKFFLGNFAAPEFYSFIKSEETVNPVEAAAKSTFDSNGLFFPSSINIARALYELSENLGYKEGALYVAHFKGIYLDEEEVDVIGIVKSESTESFLVLEEGKPAMKLQYSEGANPGKPEKACLIFNTGKDSGYKLCYFAKGTDANIWKNEFLGVKPYEDEFQHTRQFLSIAKNYVTKQLVEDFPVSKTDQIDLLNRTVSYFKTHEEFDKEEFEDEVFQDPKLISSFNAFDKTYREENEIPENNNFSISEQAVKKQAKIFKSILKLDKNFHIYIHGSRELIEQGIDEGTGRKYYKIYFDKES